MGTADEVRRYALEKFVRPAWQKGDNVVEFTSRDIHKGLGLEHRFPMVCSAIDSNKFLEYANVILVRREGPHQSSTVRWIFDLNR